MVAIAPLFYGYDMNRDIEKFILRIYPKLPKRFQQNHRVCAWVQPIAERLLQKARKELIRAKWKRCELETKLKQVKGGQLPVK